MTGQVEFWQKVKNVAALLHVDVYYHLVTHLLSIHVYPQHHFTRYYFISCPCWCCYILRFNLICILYVIYSHCCETFVFLSQLHPDLWRLDRCSICKTSSSVGYRGETHSLNNCAFAENVLIKVDQRQARMWVGVNVMTLAIDFGIPPKLGRSLSQEFVP